MSNDQLFCSIFCLKITIAGHFCIDLFIRIYISSKNVYIGNMTARTGAVVVVV